MYSNTISLRYFFPRARILNEIAEFEKMPLNRKTLMKIQVQFNKIQVQFNEIQVQFNEIQVQYNEIQVQYYKIKVQFNENSSSIQ